MVHGSIAAGTILISAFVSLAPAQAQSWAAAGDGTISIPASVSGNAIRGATLSCRGGKWSLRLMAELSFGGATDTAVPVALTVGRTVVPTIAQRAASTIDVPPAAIAAMRSGSRLTISFPAGGVTIQSSFPLRGSGRALDAATASCPAAVAEAPAPAATPPAATAPVAAPQGAAAQPAATLTAPAEVAAGAALAVAYTGPRDSNDWIGVVAPSAGPRDWFSGGFAYTTSPASVVLSAPAVPGAYELRYVNAKYEILARRPIEVVAAAAATLSAPDSVAGGRLVAVTHTGPEGQANVVAIVPPGDPASSRGLGQAASVNVKPAQPRAPVAPGAYELRYILTVGPSPQVVARRPITVTPPPAVAIADAQVALGGTVSIAIDNAPRESGNYLYLARPDRPDNDYAGGYVSIPAAGPVTMPAPKEAGTWAIRYVVPTARGYVALGRGTLTVTP